MRYHTIGLCSILAVAAGVMAASARAQDLGRPQDAFPTAIEKLEVAANHDPSNAAAQHVVATFYHAKLSDPALTREARISYIERGLAAEDRALAVEPDLFEALVYKNLLLRAQADLESDPARRAALIRQADDLRARATTSRVALNETSSDMNNRATASVPPPPPPPPPPPAPGAGPITWQYAETSFVTADGTSPRKVKDVSPVYPPMAVQMGVTGRVVVEATIDHRGIVTNARVVESIPVLNQATIDAVKQWRFDPATIATGAAPVSITVEARFVPRK
jgi:TonB family protein